MLAITKRHPRLFFYILLILFLSLLLSLIIFGFNTWAIADDFCNLSRALNEGPFTHTLNIYKQWSGRILTGFLMSLSFYILKTPLNFNLISSFLGLILGVVIFIISKIIFWNEKDLTQKLAFSLIFGAIFWLGLENIIGEVIFWPTGGIVYLIPLLLGVTWCWLYLKLIFPSTNANSHNKTSTIFGIILSLLVGNAIEPLSVSLLCFGVILLYQNYKSLPTSNRNAAIIRLIALIITTIVLFVAPGNFIRASYNPLSFDLNIAHLLLNYLKIIVFYVRVGHTLLFLSVILGLLMIFINITNPMTKLKLFFKKIYLNPSSNIGMAFLWAALAGIVPMTLVRGFAAPRTSLYFLIFTVIGILLIFRSIELSGTIRKMHKLSLLKYIVPIMVGIYLIIIIILDSKQASTIRSQFFFRDNLIKSVPVNTEIVSVPSITGMLPKRIHFDDILPDSKYWINGCIAKYYKIKEVQIKD